MKNLTDQECEKIADKAYDGLIAIMADKEVTEMKDMVVCLIYLKRRLIISILGSYSKDSRKNMLESLKKDMDVEAEVATCERERFDKSYKNRS